jgi:hypothetical protein
MALLRGKSMTYRRSNPIDAMPNAARWRTRAEAMRTMAEETNDPAVRGLMLRIAADYDRLARRPERLEETSPSADSDDSARPEM